MMSIIFNSDTSTSSNHGNNALLANNIRAPQTPVIHNNPAESAITVHNQNGPVTLPIDEPLPAGYAKIFLLNFQNFTSLI